MGWGANDPPIRERLQVQVSLARAEVYKLGQLLEQISHAEKKAEMQKDHLDVGRSLDSIARTLSR